MDPCCCPSSRPLCCPSRCTSRRNVPYPTPSFPARSFLPRRQFHRKRNDALIYRRLDVISCTVKDFRIDYTRVHSRYAREVSTTWTRNVFRKLNIISFRCNCVIVDTGLGSRKMEMCHGNATVRETRCWNLITSV